MANILLTHIGNVMNLNYIRIIISTFGHCKIHSKYIVCKWMKIMYDDSIMLFKRLNYYKYNNYTWKKTK